MVRTREIEVGSTVAGRYRIDVALGKGGFGTVFRATDLQRDAVVALKAMHFVHTGRDVLVRRFTREAALLATLDHPHIVRTFDYGITDEAVPFTVFELLDGRSLRDELDAVGRLDVRRAAHITWQVLAALEHAHERGVVHRDIKPSNIFLSTENAADRVRVLDFGIAKGLTPDGPQTQLTLAGQLLGTPAYMAPEQVRGSDLGLNLDLYSLGLVLGEMLTGRPLMEGAADIDILVAHITDDPVPLPEAVRSGPLGAVVVRAVEKNPARRFITAQAMRQAIEATPGLTPTSATVALPVSPQSSARGASDEVVGALSATTPARSVTLPARRRPLRIAWALGALAMVALIAMGSRLRSVEVEADTTESEEDETDEGESEEVEDAPRAKKRPKRVRRPGAELDATTVRKKVLELGWHIDSEMAPSINAHAETTALIVSNDGLVGSVMLQRWRTEELARNSLGAWPDQRPAVVVHRAGRNIIQVGIPGAEAETQRLADQLLAP